MTSPIIPERPDTTFPDPSPAHPPNPDRTPLPEPSGMPDDVSDEVPPFNEPLGIPSRGTFGDRMTSGARIQPPLGLSSVKGGNHFIPVGRVQRPRIERLRGRKSTDACREIM